VTGTKTALSRASELIRSSRRPLLVCHVGPDDDAVGSLTALGRGLSRMGLQPTMACSDPIPRRFSYIPGSQRIVQEPEGPFDLVVSVDCSDLRRLGQIADLPGFDQVELVNIDHHVTNPGFGQVNLVDTDASCTAEIVLELLDHMGVDLDSQTATSLLAGVVGDTRGFRTTNVTTEVMETALRLMRTGASLPGIVSSSLDRRTVGALRLWGEALGRLRIEERLIWTVIPLESRRACGFDEPGDAGLAGLLIGAEEADVAAVLSEEEDGSVEVSLRAAPGFDVARVAAEFGGGGHALAAGCLVPGPLGDAERRVISALRAHAADSGETPGSA
jgi:phosphoesterase RecJ-like protein